jgi:succinate-semialdehyde dehydrogenase/glutarate-semialdehyde dehydrogenase
MTDQHFESINPATQEVISRTAKFSTRELEKALEQADRQARSWALSSFTERSALLEAVADQLESRCDEFAGLITREMGKLLRESRAEVEKCAWVCRYYAEHGEAFLTDEVIESDAERSLVAYQPLGTVLAVMPWNFPFWQVFRFAAPAIAAGNVGLLKHASNVMQCSASIGDLFTAAGAPEGLFTHLAIDSAQVGKVIEDPRVQAVTLTGSEPAGRAVAAQAGRVLKKCVLELGGSDPFVVLADADLELAVAKGVQSRFMNAGQSCIAAKRFIVVDGVADEFAQRFTEAAASLRQGDPMLEETQLAPMAREDLREELDAQVRDALAQGVELLTGGAPHEGRGWFYHPTVISGVIPGMRAYSEELFGPVASILRARDEAHALQIANDSRFGLGGSVWTRKRERGLSLARRLECGCAFVNELVKSDPRLPFGGIKSSGYGRELSHHGIHEFVNAKTLWVD